MGRNSKKGSLGMQWFTTGVSTTLVLVLLGMVAFSILFARRLSDKVKENLTVMILVSDKAEQSDVERLRTTLKEAPYTAGLTYISKEQALKEYVKSKGSDPSEFLGKNPFTASFELRMGAEYANTDSMAHVTSVLKKDKCVEDVIYQRELVDAINTNLHRLGYVLLTLAALLALVSLALINNTVRLSIFAGRFVIRTMKLVGASWGFIRRPFMWRSFRLGLLSGIAADGILLAGVHGLLQYDPSTAEYITAEMLAEVGAAVLLFGLLLTLGCTYFSVNRYLRLKAAELY